MRRLIPLALVLLVGFGIIACAMTLDEALALFSGSDIMVQYNDEGRAQLEGAIAAFLATLGVPEDLDQLDELAVNDFYVDPANKDLLNKLSQAYYTLADAFLSGEEEEESTYVKGKNWGMKSLRMDPTFAEIEGPPTKDIGRFIDAVKQETDIAALYWTGANWLRVAEFNKVKAVFAKIPDQTEVMYLRCLELDDTYMNYGSYRALGAFWGGLPRLGILVHYSKNFNKSLGYFCKVVNEPEICAECNDCPDFGPVDPAADEYFENRLFFVQYYLMEKGMWEDAKRILDEVLAEPVGEKYPLYNAISQEKAAEFLEEVEEHL